MEIFEASKNFPAEEKYSLIDQIRRSSRSVCTNLRETETWLDFAHDCGYLSNAQHAMLTEKCREVGAMLGSMINASTSFILKSPDL
jgi:hypothetical protein